MGCLLNSLEWITKRQSWAWERTGTWGVSSKAEFLLLHVNSLNISCWDYGSWNPIICINDIQGFRTCKATSSRNGESQIQNKSTIQSNIWWCLNCKSVTWYCPKIVGQHKNKYITAHCSLTTRNLDQRGINIWQIALSSFLLLNGMGRIFFSASDQK